MEHFRAKGDDTALDGEGFWEEAWKGHTDTKPFGSSSVGLDLSFIGHKFIYGLPEHADAFALRSTRFPLKNSKKWLKYNKKNTF